MQGQTDPQQLFAEIWPEGMPERERLVWEAISARERGTILKRIEAAFRGERGERWSDLAEGVGLKRAGFYKLRAGWRDHGIAGVVPNQTQQVRRVAVPDDHPLRSSAAALLRSEGGRARNVDLARRLLGGAPAKSGRELAELQKVERLVQHERRALALDPEFLAKTFGAGLLVDLTAVSVLLDGAEPAPAIVAVVAETSSGLVMGSAIGSRVDALHLERAAIGQALGFLRARRGDRDVDTVPASDLGLTLPPGVTESDADVDLLRGAVAHLEFGRPGGFGYGQALVQLVGPRIGRMVLAPRRTLPADGAAYASTRVAPVMTLEQAGAQWAREVLRHNEPVLKVLEDASLIDADGVASGPMTSALMAADVLLATLAGPDQPRDS
ncbi:hypothetical protein [uncultured Sphingomonas sp.]|uniref:hypothetical protein n=1 Tax=uncultured Sphingomonas sp. TaxID=158754 RepID=UPI002626D851|nr:hypothetical protein [uncultured Sphingomonas sp.]